MTSYLDDEEDNISSVSDGGTMKKNAYIMNNFTGQRTKENIENVYSSSMLFF